MNVYLAKLMTYYEIHRMDREGHSKSKISQYLGVNRRTVSKLLSMSEQEYEEFLNSRADRKKILSPYENFVKDRLILFQDTPAAQMHDWLKEHYQDFPQVSQKTVFNFVSRVRDKYNLPVIKEQRQHNLVEELPYGKQAQVDFGEYNLRTSTGKRAKVYFFTFVLSRSRFKYVWFIDQYFTSELAAQAHERAFEYIQGMPDEIIYDQDKVFIVSENGGDIILTDGFRAYTRTRDFSIYFCRKADPQSKGKIENVVKYVKQNFLYNRTYHNIETLNDEALGWLGRTANQVSHAFTRKEPYSELYIEQQFLKPFIPQPVKASECKYTVRKDNSISYKGNLYSLPLGTYAGRGTEVLVKAYGARLIISDCSTQKELCIHTIESGKGIKVLNNDHKRDKSKAISELTEQVCTLLQLPEKGRELFCHIRSEKPRYIRDQILIIRDTIENTQPELVSKAIDYCLENKIYSASDFKAIISHYRQQEVQTEPDQARIVKLNPLNGKITDAAFAGPEKSSIEDYSSFF